jgi:hypothetical protein
MSARRGFACISVAILEKKKEKEKQKIYQILLTEIIINSLRTVPIF